MVLPGDQPKDSASTSQRVSAYRKRMREQGLRLIQMWVPDVREPGFAAEAHRQSLLVASGPQATEDQDFIEAISVYDE